jgi:hypothetical protein
MIASGAVFLFVGEEGGDYMMKSGVGSLFVFWAVEGQAREQRVGRLSRGRSSRLSRGRGREGC